MRLDYTKKTVPSEYYKDRMLVKFENKQFYAPKEYDRILKKCYGNYMELPPEEERENHNAAKIVFEVKKGENVSE